jgi:hypothetical protein
VSVDFTVWNALVSTATLLVVAATAIAALRQIRQLRAQNTLAGLLKVLDDWRDPEFQAAWRFVRVELPDKLRDPAFVEDLDNPPIDRVKHRELVLCDWYEQVGSYMKHRLLDETIMLDVSSSSCNTAWHAVEPVITRLRSTRSNSLYENFEYMAVRGILYERAHPNGSYPRDTPRIAEIGGPAAYGKPIQRAAEAPSTETA